MIPRVELGDNLLIFACPGQGSQTPGFLGPWLDSYPSLAGRLKAYSDYCGKDLIQLGTEADEESIRDTAVAQRLIVGSSLAIYREVFSGLALDGSVGHSVGEIAAAAIAEVISDEDAMKLVGVRADAMAAAAGKVPTSMAAVIGGDFESVNKSISEFGLEVANFNGGGQVVAAGGKDAILNLVASPPQKSRVIELKVAGAFHTSFMQDAVDEVAEFASSIQARDPKVAIWSNFDGSRVDSGEKFLELIVRQISRPVRWDLCMESFNIEGCKFVELPPAGALAGLIKRGADKVLGIAIKSPADVEKVSA